MLADALGRPLRFILTPGQTGDVTQAPALLQGCRTDHVIADTAYDSRALRAVIAGCGAIAVIPSNPTRKHPFAHDPALYKLRNRIERCFNKLKHFRRFATRYDRRAIHFLAFIHLASAMIWMR
jgi:transposase